MGIFKNTQDGQIQSASGPTADWLLNQQPEGLWVEIPQAETGELKGKHLDAALDEAGLPKSGSAAEKRAALAEYQAQQLAANTAPADVGEGQPPTEPSQQ